MRELLDDDSVHCLAVTLTDAATQWTQYVRFIETRPRQQCILELLGVLLDMRQRMVDERLPATTTINCIPVSWRQ